MIDPESLKRTKDICAQSAKRVLDEVERELAEMDNYEPQNIIEEIAITLAKDLKAAND